MRDVQIVLIASSVERSWVEAAVASRPPICACCDGPSPVGESCLRCGRHLNAPRGYLRRDEEQFRWWTTFIRERPHVIAGQFTNRVVLA